MRKILAAALCASIVGCAAPVAKIANTEYPEVMIDGVDVESVKARILDKYMSKGFSVDSETTSNLVMSKEMTGMQEALMRMTIANAYSSTARAEIAVTFVKLKGGVKAYARTSASSVMPMGRVAKTELNSPPVFNAMQGALYEVRDSFATNQDMAIKQDPQ